jgi:conjugative transfer pilus assembly protein TraH
MRRTPPVFRRQRLRSAVAVATLVAMQWTSMAQAADLSGQMQQMFEDMGAVSNATGPGAFKSQTMGIYTGGELQMRAPTRNYQFWSVTMPSINAGCGGIDAYLGSFSHINSDQFKALLQQVGANTVGLLFKAALKSINPMIESVLGDLEKTLAQYNAYSRNSCQMANALVNGMSGAFDVNSYSACISMARSFYGDDEAAAQSRCASNAPAVNAEVKAGSDEASKALALRDLNLVWDALAGSSFSRDEKETFMNIAGTVIFRKGLNHAGTGELPKPIPPSVDSLNTLLYGIKPGSTDDTVIISGWWQCNDDECLEPVQVDKEVTPFPTHVRATLLSLRDKLQSGTAPTAAEIGFINMTSVPVYRMMAIGYQGGSTGNDTYLTDMLVDRYAKLIAYDYAHTFLRRELKQVLAYIGQARLQSEPEENYGKELRDNVEALMKSLDQERSTTLARVPSLNAVVDDLQRIERQLRTGLPSSVRNMLDMSNLMTGRAGRS